MNTAMDAVVSATGAIGTRFDFKVIRSPKHCRGANAMARFNQKG
jgi:hypothetical protein